MRSRLFTFIALIVALCVCIIPLTGCAPSGNGNNPYGTQQGQRAPGGPNKDMNPNGGPTGVGIRDNTNTRLGLNAPDNARLDSTPGTPVPSPGLNRTDTAQPTRFDRQRAEKISNQLRAMRSIRDVNVVVNGNRAVVGYTPLNDNADTNSMNNKITNAVKKVDRTITQVTVSDTPDITRMINQLSNDITNNRPGNELQDSFTKLMQSIGRVTGTRR